MDNLLKNTNNLKSYINKLIREKINKDKNKENEKNKENQNELNNDDLKDLNNTIVEDLFPENKNIKNETRISDKHLIKIEDDKISKAVDIIKDLNTPQRKEILENIKSKAAENKNLDRYKKIIKRIKDSKEINNIINTLSKAKEEDDKKIDLEKTKEEEEEKDIPKPKEFKDDEFIDLAENLINNLYDEDKYVPVNKVDKYINEKEKEENMDNVANIINNMNNEDKKNMLQILNDNADNVEKKKTVKLLTDKMKEKEPNNDLGEISMDSDSNFNIIKQFNRSESSCSSCSSGSSSSSESSEESGLKDEQLGEMANNFIEDLFNEVDEPNEDKKEKEKEKNINKAANIIKDLNKNDQTKVLSFLKDNADNNNKKDKIEKVSNLVHNMNGIKLYLKGIIKKRINPQKQTSELEKEKLDDLTKRVVDNLFQEEPKDNIQDNNNENIPQETTAAPTITEEKINYLADTINKLHDNDKQKLLKTLEENAKDDKKQQALSLLKNKMRKMNQINILVDSMKKDEKEKQKEKPKEKPKLNEEQINEIAYNFSADLYYKEQEPKSSLENLIMNENKENKIGELAKTLKNLDKDAQDKALSFITNNAKNDEQKEKANKLSNLVKNIKNIKSYFGKMIKSQLNKDGDKKDIEKDVINERPIEGDLHEDEIAKIANSFWLDLNNSGEGKENSTNDIINNFANMVKEFKPQDQKKTINLLKSKAQEENNKLKEINTLENKINDLNNMKNEIQSYKNALIINNNVYPLESKDKKEDKLISTSPSKENKEIIIKELEPEKLQQLSNSFIADLNEDNKILDLPSSVKLRGKSRKKSVDDLKINNIASVITKLTDSDQKKVIENLEGKVKNDKLPKLIKRIEAINKVKTFSNIIKERKNKKEEEQKIQEDNIKSLYDNNKEENLPEEKLDNLANTFINDIFTDSDVSKEAGTQPDVNKEKLDDLIKDEKIKNASRILNNLNDKDKKLVLDKLTNYVKEKEKEKEKDTQTKNQVYLKKLQKLLNNLDKMKLYRKRIREKMDKEKKQIVEPEIDNTVSEENIDEQKIVDDFIGNITDKPNDELKDDEENIIRMANVIAHYKKDNQEKIINKLKEESTTPQRKIQINKLLKRIEYLNQMKNLAKKVKERKALKKAEQEINNEENYGIIVNDMNDKTDNINGDNIDTSDKIVHDEVIIKKPEELKENDLNKLTGYFISDIYEDGDNKKLDENGNEIKDNSVEKYKKIKRMEKKMNDVVDTINILDDNDRQKVLDTMKENAKNNEQKLRYKRLINLITKGLDKLERQKQIAKQQKLKELEEQKKLIQSGNKIEQNVENVMIKQEPDQKEETQIKEELNEPNKVIENENEEEVKEGEKEIEPTKEKEVKDNEEMIEVKIEDGSSIPIKDDSDIKKINEENGEVNNAIEINDDSNPLEKEEIKNEGKSSKLRGRK